MKQGDEPIIANNIKSGANGFKQSTFKNIEANIKVWPVHLKN
ncbi:TPA: hypothetical protein ACOQ4Y_000832 [Bacillus cereus]